MYTLKQLALVILGPAIPTAFHRFARLTGFLVNGEITLRSFAGGLRWNSVSVYDKNHRIRLIDGSLDRMMSCCPDDDIDIEYVGRWFMNPCTLLWSRPVVGRDVDGYFHPGVEFCELGDVTRIRWIAPFVSFAAARRAARGDHAECHWSILSRPGV